MGKRLRINIGTLNFAKGMAIILMIVGHSITELVPLDQAPILWGLLSPLLPFFYIISGYLFTPKKIYETVKTTAKDLLKPYLIVEIVNLIIYPLRSLWQGKGYLAGLIKMGAGILFGVGMDTEILGISVASVGPVWFLVSLFWAWNLLNLIMKLKSLLEQIAMIILVVVAGYLLAWISFSWWSLSCGLIGTGYLAIGYYLKKYKIMEKKAPLWAIALLAAGALWNTRFSKMLMIKNVYSHGLFTIILAVCSCYFMLWACIYLSHIDFVLVDAIEECGRYSFWILCIHAVLYTSLPWHIFFRIMPNSTFAVLALLVYNAIVILIVCYLLKEIHRWKYMKEKKKNGRKDN
ncbi:MAG: acyltransferase family protein [Acetatifactor sp.]|nr:acyltransferase family protein [Acetatifactor sp.]